MSIPLNAGRAAVDVSENRKFKYIDPKLLSEYQQRITRLESLLAIELQRAAELLKENQELEVELKTVKAELSYYEKKCEKLIPGDKFCCNREEAMAVSAMPSTPEPGE